MMIDVFLVDPNHLIRVSTDDTRQSNEDTFCHFFGRMRPTCFSRWRSKIRTRASQRSALNDSWFNHNWLSPKLTRRRAFLRTVPVKRARPRPCIEQRSFLRFVRWSFFSLLLSCQRATANADKGGTTSNTIITGASLCHCQHHRYVRIRLVDTTTTIKQEEVKISVTQYSDRIIHWLYKHLVDDG